MAQGVLAEPECTGQGKRLLPPRCRQVVELRVDLDINRQDLRHPFAKRICHPLATGEQLEEMQIPTDGVNVGAGVLDCVDAQLCQQLCRSAGEEDLCRLVGRVCLKRHGDHAEGKAEHGLPSSTA